MRKININYNTLRARAFWLLFTAGVFTMLVFSIQRKNNSWLSNIEVHIEDLPGNQNLIEEEQIVKSLQAQIGFELDKTRIKELDLMQLEQFLNSKSSVQKSEIWVDAVNVLHVEVEQRRPIVRINDETGQSYYMDSDGHRIYSARKKALRVPVVTGNVPKYKYDLINKQHHTLNDLLIVSRALEKDPFLYALVEQIQVNKGQEFVFIPKIGNEKIVFGQADHIDEKLENLKVFYKEGLTREGWGKYSHINLEIQGQVYATLRNP